MFAAFVVMSGIIVIFRSSPLSVVLLPEVAVPCGQPGGEADDPPSDPRSEGQSQPASLRSLCLNP